MQFTHIRAIRLRKKLFNKIVWSIVIECNRSKQSELKSIGFALERIWNGLSKIIAAWTTPTNVDTHFSNMPCNPSTRDRAKQTKSELYRIRRKRWMHCLCIDFVRRKDNVMRPSNTKYICNAKDNEWKKRPSPTIT